MNNTPWIRQHDWFKLLAIWMLGCGNVGVTNGPYLTFEYTLSEFEEKKIEDQIALAACDKIERKTHRDCDIHNDMHKLVFTWVDGNINVYAEFEP